MGRRSTRMGCAMTTAQRRCERKPSTRCTPCRRRGRRPPRQSRTVLRPPLPPHPKRSSSSNPSGYHATGVCDPSRDRGVCDPLSLLLGVFLVAFSSRDGDLLLVFSPPPARDLLPDPWCSAPPVPFIAHRPPCRATSCRTPLPQPPLYPRAPPLPT
jgi:hypothetical protein